MRTRVKICGITRPEDLDLAVRLGADAVGFIFAPGPRQLTPIQARDLSARVPAWVSRVGVFGPDQKREAPAIAEACRLDTLQLHGAPDPAFCAYFRPRFSIVQALGVGPDAAASLEDQVAELAPHVDALLLDTAKSGQLGGTGQVFDWELLANVAPHAPLIIAGGLKPTNVADLLTRFAPWGVDVASGVEASPGIKDEAAMRAFFEAVASVK